MKIFSILISLLLFSLSQSAFAEQDLQSVLGKTAFSAWACYLPLSGAEYLLERNPDFGEVYNIRIAFNHERFQAKRLFCCADEEAQFIKDWQKWYNEQPVERVFSPSNFHPLFHQILTTLYISNNGASVEQKGLALEILGVGHEVLGYVGGFTTPQINTWFINARRRNSARPSDVISKDTRKHLSLLFKSSSHTLTERNRAVLAEDFTKDILALKNKDCLISHIIGKTPEPSSEPEVEASEEALAKLEPLGRRKRTNSSSGPAKKRKKHQNRDASGAIELPLTKPSEPNEMDPYLYDGFDPFQLNSPIW
jgi:hypothetical protein